MDYIEAKEEEAKEKESCDKSLSEESKELGGTLQWKAYPQDSQPKFIENRTHT